MAGGDSIDDLGVIQHGALPGDLRWCPGTLDIGHVSPHTTYDKTTQ